MKSATLEGGRAIAGDVCPASLSSRSSGEKAPRLPQILVAPRDQRDVRPGFGQGDSDSPPEPAARPRDERRPSF